MQSGFLAIAFSVLLIGCSPTYDWREVQPADEPLALMLPAKPSSMTRQINLDGIPVAMRMHGALVNETSFTAAWAELDESDVAVDARPAFRAKAIKAMQTGMARNIAGTVETREVHNVRLIDESSRPVGQVPGELLTIRGTARGKAAVLHGLFVGFGSRVYQFVVIGEQIPDQQIKTFIESIQLRIEKPSAVAAR